MKRRAAAPLLALGLLGAGGCAAQGAGPKGADWAFEVRAAAAPTTLPADADETVVLNTVAWVIVNDLGLPLPDAVPAMAYGNETAFVEALVRRGMEAERATDRARVSLALASDEAIFVRADLVDRMSLPSRVSVYAHELAHIAQGRLQRGQIGSPVWLREGHADWVMCRVLDLLGYRSYEHSLNAARRAVGGGRTPPAQFPSLRELETGEAWLEAIKTFGGAATYGQALLAVDRLVERYGEERLRAFFETFGGPDRVLRPGDVEYRHWTAVYPVPYRDFAAEFHTWLESLR